MPGEFEGWIPSITPRTPSSNNCSTPRSHPSIYPQATMSRSTCHSCHNNYMGKHTHDGRGSAEFLRALFQRGGDAETSYSSSVESLPPQTAVAYSDHAHQFRFMPCASCSDFSMDSAGHGLCLHFGGYQHFLSWVGQLAESC